jgi:hypothetical protein
MRLIPHQLLTGVFTRAQARELGMTDAMLEGSRFVRVLPRVWRATDYVMHDDDWVRAARLALPTRAHLTGLSRIQASGLDFGPRLPVRFVIEGELHLAFDNVFLHRTKKLPPIDELGVVVSAAFISYCAQARVVDAIKVGDWLLHGEHMSVVDIRTLALAELWRPGADEAIWVLEHLDERARSLPESETRAILTFAGLPRAKVNLPIELEEGITVIGDLVYREWGLFVEYEGAHHQQDRSVYSVDVDRYASLRAHELRYVQVTKEKLRHARTLAGEVFRQLLVGGYTGPPPSFRGQWELLWLPVRAALGPRRWSDRRMG